MLEAQMICGLSLFWGFFCGKDTTASVVIGDFSLLLMMFPKVAVDIEKAHITTFKWERKNLH